MNSSSAKLLVLVGVCFTVACSPGKAGGPADGGSSSVNGDAATNTTNNNNGSSETCAAGATETCCVTGTRSCPGGEFPFWGPCLDANGQTLTCVDETDGGPMETTFDGGVNGTLPPIDTACSDAPVCKESAMSVYPAATPLVPPDVPLDCKNGFELGDAKTCSTGAKILTLPAKPGGSRAITLDVDFATYLEPDGVLITGIDAQGQTYTLLNTCRIQTWTSADPTGGVKRPPDETIRQFRLDVKAGTTEIDINFGGVLSPIYLQVLGLCDFNLPATFTGAKWYQTVP